MADSKIRILDCTLRDGSYAVDFQFLPRHTSFIASGLESCGIDLIEIGHGLGIDAYLEHGDPAADDLSHMKAASSELTRARWGMFCLPGIGTISSIERAAEAGMNFIRIGANATEIDKALPLIERARRSGLLVCSNLMKSYLLPPEEIARKAITAESAGASVVYLVDSAGCMTPETVKEYITCMSDRVEIPVGFHGHDNLNMATANTVAAFDAGATYLDCTLQGIGRGGGNAATETVVAMLQRRGMLKHIKLATLLKFSKKFIPEMMPRARLDDISVACGLYGFHSSWLPRLLKYAESANVEPFELIREVCNHDRISPSDELMQDCASRLGARDSLARQRQENLSYPTGENVYPILHSHISDIKQLITLIRAKAKTRGCRSVLNLYTPDTAGTALIPSHVIQEDFDIVIGSAKVGDASQLATILKETDGRVDYLLVDTDRHGQIPVSLYEQVKRIETRSTVLPYSDTDIWCRSLAYQIMALPITFEIDNVVLLGHDRMTIRLAGLLLDRNISVTLTSNNPSTLSDIRHSLLTMRHDLAHFSISANPLDACSSATILVSFGRDGNFIDMEMISCLTERAAIIDAGICAVSSEVMELCHQKGLRVLRPDMRAAMAAEVMALINSQNIFNEKMGRRELCGIQIVAGGQVGRRGDIVVDSVKNPSRIVGIADGTGNVTALDEHTHSRKVATLEKIILHTMLSDTKRDDS